MVFLISSAQSLIFTSCVPVVGTVSSVIPSKLYLLGLGGGARRNNLISVVGVTWVITLGGGGEATSAMGIRTHVKDQVRKRGKVCLNEFLIYIHPFLPFSPQFFCLSLFNSVANKLFSAVKETGSL
jgi:hypothetical protein